MPHLKSKPKQLTVEFRCIYDSTHKKKLTAEELEKFRELGCVMCDCGGPMVAERARVR